MHRRLRPKVLECHDEVILMYNSAGVSCQIVSAKEARLLHGWPNLALLGIHVSYNFRRICALM